MIARERNEVKYSFIAIRKKSKYGFVDTLHEA